MENNYIEPVPGTEYWYYDDGKIRRSREYRITIDKVLTRKQLKKELTEEQLERLAKHVNYTSWMWKEGFTGYDEKFALGVLRYGEDAEDIAQQIFMWASGRFWFSVYDGWWDGELDVTGKLHDALYDDQY